VTSFTAGRPTLLKPAPDVSVHVLAATEATMVVVDHASHMNFHKPKEQHHDSQYFQFDIKGLESVGLRDR
jgi:hypothetical protein